MSAMVTTLRLPFHLLKNQLCPLILQSVLAKPASHVSNIHGHDEGSLHSEHSIEQNNFLHLIDDEAIVDDGDAQASIANLNRMFDEVQDQVEEDSHSLLHTSFKAIPAFLGSGPSLSLIDSMPWCSAGNCCLSDFHAIPSFLAKAYSNHTSSD